MLEKNLKRLFYLVIAVCLLAAATIAIVKAQNTAKLKVSRAPVKLAISNGAR